MSASRTAHYAALYRALESAESTRAPRLSEQLAPHGLRQFARAARMPALRGSLPNQAERRAAQERTPAVARSRFMDDQVRAAARAGIAQFVLLGAGHDCHAFRARAPELQGAEVFQLGRPGVAAGRENQQRQPGRAGLTPPKGIRCVPIDFQLGDLTMQLSAAGFDWSKRALFIWEGVTTYLDAPSVERVLAAVGRAAVGSRIVFTYLHRGLLDGSVNFELSARPLHSVRRMGEPWRFGLDPRELPGFLAKFGLLLEADLGADAYRRRYLDERAPGLRAYGFYRLVTAHVIGAQAARQS